MTPPVSRFLGRGTELFRLKAGQKVSWRKGKRATEAFSPLDGGVSQGFIPFVYPCCIRQGMCGFVCTVIDKLGFWIRLGE